MLVLDGSVTKKPNKQKGLEKKRNPESELSGRRRNRQKAKRVRKNALSLQNSRVSTLVEATGLEPTTSCSRSKRATKLRYASPTDEQKFNLKRDLCQVF